MNRNKIFVILIISLIIIGTGICAVDGGRYYKTGKKIATDIAAYESIDYLLTEASRHLGEPLGNIQKDVLSNTQSKLKNKLKELCEERDEITNLLNEDTNMKSYIRNDYQGQLILIQIYIPNLENKINELEQKIKKLG